LNKVDNSGVIKNVVLKVSWYSECKSVDKGKKHVVSCKNESFMMWRYKVLGKVVSVLVYKRSTSKWENLITVSKSTCLFTKDDWVTKLGKLQSIVIKLDVFSQFKESVSHIWFEDLYVDTQLISLKALNDFIIYVI
jgi:hypothetical protein